MWKGDKLIFNSLFPFFIFAITNFRLLFKYDFSNKINLYGSDDNLASRIREALSHISSEVEEMKMMGGLCFMVNDKMCVGIVKEDLMCRIDPEFYDQALERPGARPMDFTSRPMKGFVFVSPEGLRRNEDLRYWIDLAWTLIQKPKLQKVKRSN